MTSPFIITGVPTTPGSNGSVPVRHEIRDLQQNYPEQWNLFCLGLLQFQEMNESDQLSYYGVAGIHGLPYRAWNGVTSTDNQQTGYCTHSSILFLPWHRPYLCLFEQLLCSKIQNIAESYTGTLKSKYISAANDFRLPYWDWGLQPPKGQPGFPSSIAGPAQIQVTGIDGKQQTIRNPLLQYDFNVNNLSSGDFPDFPYNTWATTLRYPKASDPSTTSQDALVNKAISSQLQTIRSQIRSIFYTISQFGPFSNDKWTPGSPGNYPSLENIHNNIHVLVGGPSPSNQSAPAGNMSIVPYAAFDPVFWMHHCNVDRMFAIFQALHPGSYVESEPTLDGTFTEKPGYIETVTSNLTPFWKNNTTFHTSETAKSTITLGYTYPETQSWNYATTTSYQKSVRAAVTKLYGSTTSNSGAILAPPTGSLAAGPGFQQGNGAANGKPIIPPTLRRGIINKGPGESFAPMNTLSTIADNSMQHDDTSSHSRISDKIKNATAKDDSLILQGGEHRFNTSHGGSSNITVLPKHKEWIFNIRVQKHSLGGPFQIHCFLGSIPSDTSSWLIHANNVGTCSILGSNPATTSCEKCKTDASESLIVTGVIPLTEALRDAILQGNLPSLMPTDVEPYLAEKLHWRVTQVSSHSMGREPNLADDKTDESLLSQTDGTERSREEVNGLQVSVISTEFTASTEPDEFPSYSGEYTLHPVCTQGRPGGYNHGDQY